VTTQAKATIQDNIRTIHSSAVANELIQVTIPKDTILGFELSGYITNANYHSKKTTFLLFINSPLPSPPLLSPSSLSRMNLFFVLTPRPLSRLHISKTRPRTSLHNFPPQRRPPLPLPLTPHRAPPRRRQHPPYKTRSRLPQRRRNHRKDMQCHIQETRRGGYLAEIHCADSVAGCETD